MHGGTAALMAQEHLAKYGNQYPPGTWADLLPSLAFALIMATALLLIVKRRRTVAT